MSNPFVLQQKVLKQILKDRPSVEAGMAMALKMVRAAKHGEAWKKCGPVNGEKLTDQWVKWFDALIKKHPPRKKIGLLWFEALHDLNPAMTSVSGYEKLDRTAETFGLEAGRFWPVDRKGDTVKEGLLPLPELDAFFARAGWVVYSQVEEEPSAEAEALQERLRPGFYALSFAAVALLVINGLSRTRFFQSAGAVQAGVMVGWVEGGEEPIGILSAAGWRPLTLDRGSLKVPAICLDPTSVMLRVKDYIEAGGDPNWRDKRSGRTALMEQSGERGNMRALIAAGADVNAVDKDGRNVLHHLDDLGALGPLLESGADLACRAKDGFTAFDRVAAHGGCRGHHLEMMWKAGGRPTRDERGMLRPLRELGVNGPVERDVLRFWKKRKIDFNEADRDGATPLWLNLARHARQCAEWNSMAADLQDDPSSEFYVDKHAIALLAEGADPDARAPEIKARLVPKNATPLMLRCYHHDRLVRALLKHGADPLAKSADGKTALDYARAAAASKSPDAVGAKKVVRLLERAVKAAEKKATRRKS